MLSRLLRLIVRIFFRHVVIEGRENLPASGPLIVTPNHPNALLDPLLLMFLSPDFQMRFVAKAPLFKIPVLGWLMRWMGAISVVRRFEAKGEVDYAAFFAACVDALAVGDSIAIFPEGRSLPQPSMAPLRTGAARLYFLARQRGVDAKIVPIGLNFEQGSVFRSSVVMSIAPPVRTVRFVEKHATDPQEAVRGLTAEIGRSLQRHVFQAETFRDRQLLLLLERLYAKDDGDRSWPERLARLKQLEEGLARLRDCYGQEIDRLRHLLGRYERLSVISGVGKDAGHHQQRTSIKRIVAALAGLPMAGLGLLLNWLPYRVCGMLVWLTRRDDEAAAATFKVVYSLFLFPLTYVIEGLLIDRWLGRTAAIVFAAVIVPLSYFTLRYFEWVQERVGGIELVAARFGRGTSKRVADRLSQLRRRIVAEVDVLAAHLEHQSGDKMETFPPS